MMFKTKVLLCLLALIVVIGASPFKESQAAIVKLNAKTSTVLDDNWETATLDAGTYSISLVPPPDAWDGWKNDSTRGFRHDFHMNTVGTPENLDTWFKVGTTSGSIYYDNIEDAFYAFPGFTFTLDETTDVAFGIWDLTIGDPNQLWYDDNIGGLNLSVEAVPIGSTLWLFGSGIVGLVGLRRRNK